MYPHHGRPVGSARIAEVLTAWDDESEGGILDDAELAAAVASRTRLHLNTVCLILQEQRGRTIYTPKPEVRTKVSPKQASKIVFLRAQGKNLQEIVRATRLSTITIRRVLIEDGQFIDYSKGGLRLVLPSRSSRRRFIEENSMGRPLGSKNKPKPPRPPRPESSQHAVAPTTTRPVSSERTPDEKRLHLARSRAQDCTPKFWLWLITVLKTSTVIDFYEHAGVLGWALKDPQTRRLVEAMSWVHCRRATKQRPPADDEAEDEDDEAEDEERRRRDDDDGFAESEDGDGDENGE